MGLNFPEVILQTKEIEGNVSVFDPIRKKFVPFTPEEEVRQHILYLLLNYLDVPAGLIAVEKQIKYHSMSKRPDVTIYDRQMKPLMLIECKAPEIRLDDRVLIQAAAYHKVLPAPYLLFSNGLNHYCFYFDKVTHKLNKLDSIPHYGEMAVGASR